MRSVRGFVNRQGAARNQKRLGSLRDQLGVNKNPSNSDRSHRSGRSFCSDGFVMRLSSGDKLGTRRRGRARIGMLRGFWEEGTVVVGGMTHVASGLIEIKGSGNQRHSAR